MRQNNIFRRLGIPSPDRVPLLGEMIEVARKVNQYWLNLIPKSTMNLREFIWMISNWYKNMDRSSGKIDQFQTSMFLSW